MKPFLPVVIALTILGSTVYGEPTPEEKTRIETLIRQLGDDEGAVRREATRALAEIGAPALPALQRASKSEDPEVRMRAKQLVDR